MDNFEKMIHEMFDHIWNCEIDHPIFQDTVGDLMKDVIELVMVQAIMTDFSRLIQILLKWESGLKNK